MLKTVGTNQRRDKGRAKHTTANATGGHELGRGTVGADGTVVPALLGVGVCEDTQGFPLHGEER